MEASKITGVKYLLALAMIVCGLVLLTGFKSDQATRQNNGPETHVVTIFRMKYNPADLVVKQGDTVVWVNKDFYPHDVTEETALEWTSKPFGQGGKWSKVIDKDIKYFCNLHKVMKGTITVIE